MNIFCFIAAVFLVGCSSEKSTQIQKPIQKPTVKEKNAAEKESEKLNDAWSKMHNAADILHQQQGPLSVTIVKSYPVKVNYDLTFGEAWVAGKYASKNTWIGRDFAEDRRGVENIAINLVTFGRAVWEGYERIAIVLDENNLRLANVRELLALGSQHPDLVREKTWILGEYSKFPRTSNGESGVPALYWNSVRDERNPRVGRFFGFLNEYPGNNPSVGDRQICTSQVTKENMEKCTATWLPGTLFATVRVHP